MSSSNTAAGAGLPPRPLPLDNELEQLNLLQKIYGAFQEALELESVFQRVYDMLPEMLGVSRASILLYDAEAGGLVSDQYIGAMHRGEELISAPQPIGHSISGVCFAEVRPIVIDDCSITSLIPAEHVERLKLKSAAAVPIIWKDNPIGVLRVDDSYRTHSFSAAHVSFYELVAEQLAVFVQNARLFSDLRQREKELTSINSQLVKARDSALKTHEAKSAFLTRVSHELRTPLNAILGYNELLREDAQAAGRTALDMDLAKMRTASDHLMKVVTDLLDLSRIEAGKIRLRKEAVNICELLEDVTASLRPIMERRGNRQELYCPAGIGFAEGDTIKVQQVLESLLVNAAHFTERGTVTVTADTSMDGSGKRWILVQISDNGDGLTKPELDRLFEAFHQVEAEDLRTPIPRRGTGLGLAISRHLCRLMKGDLTADSIIGKGSTFTMTLPALKSEA